MQLVATGVRIEATRALANPIYTVEAILVLTECDLLVLAQSSLSHLITDEDPIIHLKV